MILPFWQRTEEVYYIMAMKRKYYLKIDDNYQKLRKIPFGFFASAGDYLIAECFYRMYDRDNT